jgi:hypothetical protein
VAQGVGPEFKFQYHKKKKFSFSNIHTHTHLFKTIIYQNGIYTPKAGTPSTILALLLQAPSEKLKWAGHW